MRSGRLRHTVELQRPVDVRDAAGGVTRTWRLVESRRCSKEPTGGRVFESLKQQYAQLSDIFRLRHIDVSSDWRLVFDGEPYRIISVQNIKELNKETLIVTERDTPETKNYGH